MYTVDMTTPEVFFFKLYKGRVMKYVKIWYIGKFKVFILSDNYCFSSLSATVLQMWAVSCWAVLMR